MNLEQLKQKLNSLSDGLKNEIKNAVVLPASLKLLANFKNRIFKDGKDSNEQELGSYSTKPTYASKTNFANKSGFKNIGKTGNKIKTMYLGGGYKQFREIQGRSTKKNLDLTGSLRSSVQLGVKENEIVLGITSQKESLKARGNEWRLNKDVFKLSRTEIEEYKKDTINGVEKLIKKLLK